MGMAVLNLRCPNGTQGTYQVVFDVEREQVVIADVEANDGMSSTNCFEHLATEIWQSMLRDFHISGPAVRWLQLDSMGHWFEVSMPWLGLSYGVPTWKACERPDLPLCGKLLFS